MGLDMYLEGHKFFWGRYSDREAKHEDGFRVKGSTLELGYWRKHPNLHGFIVNTFAGGKDECQQIELSADNLRAIVAAVNSKQLPHTEGFFFGASDLSDKEIEYDVKCLTDAINWLEAEDQGAMKSVIYQASW